MYQRTTALPSVDGGGSQYSMGCRSGSAIKGRQREFWKRMTWCLFIFCALVLLGWFQWFVITKGIHVIVDKTL